MSQMKETLRALVTERLTAAIEEIFVLVERTIAEYEEELCRSKEENQRKQQLLDSALGPRGAVSPTEAAVSGLKQENCDDLAIHKVQVKEEDPEDVPITLPRQHTSVTIETMGSFIEGSIYFTDSNHEVVAQNWTIPLNVDDGAVVEAVSESTGHEFSIFPKQRKYKCSLCNLKFARQCELKRHMAVHSCPLCQRTCTKKKLKLHMMLHTGELPFQCPKCDKRLRTKAILNAHVKMHAQGRPFSCSFQDRRRKNNRFSSIITE